MKHKFSDIEFGFEYVSSQPPLINSAILSLETGHIYWLSDFGDSDEDLPDDLGEGDQYVEIPHMNDLDLGQRLVHRFIRNHAPELSHDVAEMFSRRGAYARLKSALRTKGLLDAWHEYAAEQSETALRKWCEDNGIELSAENADQSAP